MLRTRGNAKTSANAESDASYIEERVSNTESIKTVEKYLEET
jgi:hypothetical protein